MIGATSYKGALLLFGGYTANSAPTSSLLNSQITEFLKRSDVMEDLGVNRTWAACRELEELLVIKN